MNASRCLIIGLLICLLAAADAAAQPVPAHAIAGVWTNPDYNGQGRSGRVVYKAGGKNVFLYTACDNADGSGNVYTGKVVYKKVWKGAKGYWYGLSTVTLMGMSWETLDRISPDGRTLEVQPGGGQTMDPKNPRYSVYTKKK